MRAIKHRKIAISLAIIGAIAAPFVSGTWKAPAITYTTSWVPLTAAARENFSAHIQKECSEKPSTDDSVFCAYLRGELDEGGSFVRDVSAPKYLALNLAADRSLSLTGLVTSSRVATHYSNRFVLI
jgi:hypothetical protein